PPPPALYTLSLHDALPICLGGDCSPCTGRGLASRRVAAVAGGLLPHRFSLTCVTSGAATQAVCFLCHFPSAFAASLTGASCPAVSGLSSTSCFHGAAVTRP